jgi:SAM-dependent methyltransferase
MASIYEDGTYLERNPAWHEQDAPWKVDQIRKMLARNDLVPQRVCDIGCGTGEVLRLLAESGPGTAAYVGYDISPQAHEVAKKKENARLAFRLGNMPSAADEPFDLITCMDVFEHVEDYLSFLRSIRTQAEFKVFHVPLDLSVQTVLRRGALLQRRTGVGHIHYFTKELALAVLRDTGYEVIDCFYTHKFCDSAQIGILNNVVKVVLKTAFAVQEDIAARTVGCSSLMVLAK